jgi:rhodanese-related sulfurtransferase
MWVGEMIADINQEILLVTEPGREEETIVRLSRVGYDHAIGFLNGGFESWTKEKKEIDRIKRISAAAFAAQYYWDPKIIDVRKKSEFDSEHVVNAINIPLNEINLHLDEFPKDKPFIIHCAGGYRSMIAASILKARGWENFVDVEGGMTSIASTTVLKTECLCPTTLL